MHAFVQSCPSIENSSCDSLSQKNNKKKKIEKKINK